MSADVTPGLADRSPAGYVKTARLHDIIEACAKRLRIDCPLIADAGIRVLPEYDGDLWNNINKILNKSLSLLVVVGLEDVDADASGTIAVFRHINIVVRVYESVLLNQSATGSRIPSLAVAEAACSSEFGLHNWMPSEEDVDCPQPIAMQPQKTLALDAKLSKPEAAMICWVARFETSGCVCIDS